MLILYDCYWPFTTCIVPFIISRWYSQWCV